jgi:hypothetical protein
MKLKSNLILAAVFGAFAVLSTSCTKEEGCTDPTATNYDADAEDDDGSCVYPTPAENEVVLTSNVTTDTEWTSDNVYILASRVTVVDGVTLTIQPGTIIKGQEGSGVDATALLVARGGTLIAEGEATAPIIFTSEADNITPEQVANGNFVGSNLNATNNGYWGGVIVLGKAPISASNDNGDVSEVQIEGIPTSDQNGLYGGNQPNDNSGILRYISIRHGGTNIGSGNEINGLTLGGVGSGTTIDHIEVVANQDDGVEWFGGTVNASNIVVWNCGDDGLDTDQSWAGTVSNFVVAGATGHCFELDGPEGTMEAGHTLINGTVYATADGRTSEDLINVDDNSIVNLENVFFTGIVDGQLIRESSDEEGAIDFIDVPGVTVTNIMLDLDASELENHVEGAVPAGITAGGSGQADVSVFGWTWASAAGIF